MAHNTLEEMCIVAVKQMNEGKHPTTVAVSLGLNRSRDPTKNVWNGRQAYWHAAPTAVAAH
ncbi:hypothetical protein POHY109586_19325 [Polaromonas hydrogenivorans]